jgi:glycosyltransferase involved in cell wall biosynthesis
MNEKIAGDLSIIIPAFNEEEGIENTINGLLELSINSDWEILVVNDGSTDSTGQALAKYTEHVTVVTHSKNKGYGASLKTGIKQSKNKYIAFYDADGQHQPTDLLKMYNKRESADMIIGERSGSSHRSMIRIPGKWILSKIANLLTGTNIPDLNSGLRVLKRDIVKRYLHLFPDGFSFSTTSTIAFMNLGYNVIYHPIVVRQRIGNSSVKQFRHGSSTVLLMIRLITLFNPLKIFLPVSLTFTSVGLIYGVIWGIFVLYPDIKLIPAAFFCILTGIIIFFFGLVVDQISELRKHMFEK